MGYRRRQNVSWVLFIAAGVSTACSPKSESVPATPAVLTGVMVIEPQFDRVESFSEGLALVRIGDFDTGRRGFIDKTGKFVVNPKFDDATSFSEGLAAVRIGDGKTGKWGFIDKSGAFAVKPQFASAGSFKNGSAGVRIEGPDGASFGSIDKLGRFAPNRQDVQVEEFSEGLAFLWEGERVGYKDIDGNPKVPPQFDRAAPFSEGLAAVRIGDDKTGKWGFIDKAGRFVINPQFGTFDIYFGPRFSEGLADVQDTRTGKKGFIDKTGQFVVAPQFDGVWAPFHDGLAVVQVGGDDGKWGFIDKSGKFVINPQYWAADSFREGLAAVSISRGRHGTGEWGYISR